MGDLVEEMTKVENAGEKAALEYLNLGNFHLVFFTFLTNYTYLN